jgi:uncharacterized protein YhaN
VTDPLEPDWDPDTLHERYADPDAVRARIEQLRGEVRTAADETAELLARGELVVRLRGIGALDEALTEGTRAVDRADQAGTPPQQHLARLRLAQVRQWRGEYAESNRLFSGLLDATDQFGPVIEAFTRQDAGRNAFDQARFAEARDQFAGALAIREHYELPEDQVEVSRHALAAALARLDRGGAAT